ncbi:unnamed protein product [Urochloa humidicola]
MTTKQHSILIIEVDLQCEKCFKKIQKVLCKLQAKSEDIRKVDYDNTKNTVTISGPFDPVKLSKKLRCKACDVIKDIKIVKPQEEKKAEAKKPEEKKPEEKKPDEEKKKPAAEEKKKPAEEKEKKPAEEKEKKKKPEEEKKGGDEKAKAPSSSTTTVNLLQLTNICSICYPWPCSDPAHWGMGIHHPQQQMMPQWPPFGGMPAPPAPAPPPPALPAPVHHPHPPLGPGAPQKWAPCGGPSFCGGCVWCHGGGGGGGMQWWAAAPPQAMGCPGPSLCRGCNGCKIVHETKFSYQEYPSSCAVM